MYILSGKDEEWFKELWESDSDEYEFYDLAKYLRPDLTFSRFDHAWQYLTILSEDYLTAKNHFEMAVMQAY